MEKWFFLGFYYCACSAVYQFGYYLGVNCTFSYWDKEIKLTLFGKLSSTIFLFSRSAGGNVQNRYFSEWNVQLKKFYLRSTQTRLKYSLSWEKYYFLFKLLSCNPKMINNSLGYSKETLQHRFEYSKKKKIFFVVPSTISMEKVNFFLFSHIPKNKF